MKKSLLSSCIALAIVGLPVGVAFAQTASQPAAAVAPAAAPVAASRLDAIMAKGTLRVGTTGDYRPFSYLNPESKQYEGLDIEMAQSLAQALGVKLELVPTTWANLMKDFEADKFDAAMSGVSVTLDRAKKGYFTIPLMREGKTPIARCTDKGKFETLADIDKPEVRVIVNAGGTNEKFARANLKKANIEVWKDNVTIFKQIADGKADLMMTDSSETLYQQKLNPQLCAVHPDKPFDFAEKAYWLQRDIAFKEFADQWLHLQMENGGYNAIFAKWFN
ncbi:MAG: transporter substrate-binding domain-containing protein [Burkholderiales bacterium]